MGKERQAIGVNVAIPSTVEEKMKAIVNLSKAVEHLAAALVSTNVKVDIGNNVIDDCDIGILINPESNEC